MKQAFAFVVFLSAACACAAEPSRVPPPPDDYAARSAWEQAALVKPEAVKRVLAELRKNPKYDYAKWAPKAEALVAKLGETLDALEGSDAAAKAAAIARVADYRAAMLANPVLDFDEILCVKRRCAKDNRARCAPRQAFGGTSAGMTGLNAENHMVAQRKGYDNEICVLSDFRAAPAGQKWRTIYRPKAASESEMPIVRDIDLDFDASRILFTSHKGTNNLFGVYEVPASGAETARLVSPEDGKFDVHWWDASYLPNANQVVMLGTAAYQYLPCEDGNMPMAVIYRVDRKTGEVRQLTYEQDSDYTPSVTHDGRILYTRWEYSDQPHYWSRVLMTMNPDGIGQLSVWGSNSFVPTFFYWARTVPGDPHLITMIGGGHHDRAEVGRMFLVDPTLARAYPFKYDPPDREWGPPGHTLRIPAKTFPKEKTGLVHEYPGFGEDVEGDMSDPYTMNQFARGKPYFSCPWPLDKTYNLAVVKSRHTSLMGIYLVDAYDNVTLIAENPDGVLLEPMPFRARPRPPIIPDRSRKGATTCSVHVADIYNGPGLAGVPRGTVKKFRLFSYHYNYHKTGGHSSVGWIRDKSGRRFWEDRVEAGWDVKRILGTVDVEEDGSLCFEMPANVPISLQPIDAQGRAVQLMRSWVVGMPGERVSCTGCHEDNRSSVSTKRTIADRKYFNGEIQRIKPTDADGVRPWSFANELFPVVRKYCFSCHGDPAKAPKAGFDQGGARELVRGKPSAGHELSGKTISMETAEDAYRTLHPYVRRPGPESEETLLPPMDYHASTSPLVQMLRKGHHGVKMAPEDCLKIYEWIDLNAPFHGKWDPPAVLKPDSFVKSCVPDQRARRLELQKRYANVPDDPEGECDRYAETVAKRPLVTVAPDKTVPPPAFDPKTLPQGAVWPMNDKQAAIAQLGAIHERAFETAKVLVLGKGQHLVFRRIPAGTFPMGSDSGYPDEAPRRAVTIAKPFWITEMEVQNQQYCVFDPDHDSRYQDEFGKDHVFPGHVGNHRRMPVVRVSWEEAMAFCRWLSATCGVKASLPTEAQWEWAARAGSDTPFPWGDRDADFSKFANLADRDTRFQLVGFDGGGNIRKRHPFRVDQNYPLHDERWADDWFCLNFAGRANANRWGLYDMHGNACEWTASDYRPYPYADAPNEAGALKVARGGSFNSRPRDATSSRRYAYLPWQRVFDVGFRVVLAED